MTFRELKSNRFSATIKTGRHGVFVLWIRRLLAVFSVVVSAFLVSDCTLVDSAGPDRISILAWNVQNLFDGVDDGTEYQEFDPGEGRWDDRLFRRRLDRTGEVILSSVRGGPDIVVLCEIENWRVLEELRDGPLRGRGYRYAVVSPGPGAVRIGVVSRFPILCSEIRHTGWWGERALRPLLGVEIEIGGEVLHLLAVHWKSPRDGRSATESARRDEAETASHLIWELLEGFPGREVLLVGDLNTEGTGFPAPAALAPWPPRPDEPAAAIYRTEEPGGEGIREGWVVLHDPEPDLAVGPPGTYRWEGQWERPDRALLSPGLLDERGLTFSRCRVAAYETMGDRYGDPWRWITSEEEGYSDHLPLLLEFRRVSGSGEDGRPMTMVGRDAATWDAATIPLLELARNRRSRRIPR